MLPIPFPDGSGALGQAWRDAWMRLGGPARALARAAGLGAPGDPETWSLPDNDARERMEETAAIREAGALERGMRVGEIGAGLGFWTVRLAAAVGPRGRVCATELRPERCDALARLADERGLRQVRVRWVSARDPALPRRLDRVWIVNTYSLRSGEAEADRRFLRRCAGALRPGGLLVIAHDRVRRAGFREEEGAAPLARDDWAPGELARLAEPQLAPQRLIALPPAGAMACADPGYVLVLERTPTGSWRGGASAAAGSLLAPRDHSLLDDDGM